MTVPFLLLMTGAVACHFLLTAGGDCLFPTADDCCHFLLPITIGYCLFPCRLRFDRRGAVKADKPPARLRRVNFGGIVTPDLCTTVAAYRRRHTPCRRVNGQYKRREHNEKASASRSETDAFLFVYAKTNYVSYFL